MKRYRTILAVVVLFGTLPALSAAQVSAPAQSPSAVAAQKPVEPGDEKKSSWMGIAAVIATLITALGGGGGISAMIGAKRASKSAKESIQSAKESIQSAKEARSSLDNLEVDIRNVLTDTKRSQNIWPIITERIAKDFSSGDVLFRLAAAILAEFSEKSTLRSGLTSLLEDDSYVARLAKEGPPVRITPDSPQPPQLSPEQLKSLEGVFAQFGSFYKGLEK